MPGDEIAGTTPKANHIVNRVFGGGSSPLPGMRQDKDRAGTATNGGQGIAWRPILRILPIRKTIGYLLIESRIVGLELNTNFFPEFLVRENYRVCDTKTPVHEVSVRRNRKHWQVQFAPQAKQIRLEKLSDDGHLGVNLVRIFRGDPAGNRCKFLVVVTGFAPRRLYGPH
jgi:hypothetical protein